MNNKAQASNVLPLIVVVVVSILVLVFAGALGGKTYETVESDLDSIGNNVVTGETFTIQANQTNSLAHGFVQSGTLVLYNSSTSHIGLGNFTIDYDAGTLITESGGLNNSAAIANYTWGVKEIRDNVKNGLVSSFDAMEDTGELMPLVVLSVIIGIVIVSVVGVMSLTGGKNSGGAAL